MVNKIPLIFTIQMANKRKRNTKKRNSAYNFINDYNFEISAVILFGLGIFLLIEEMEIKTYVYKIIAELLADTQNLLYTIMRFISIEIETSDIVGIALIGIAIILIIIRVRQRMVNRKTKLDMCPDCGGSLHRIHKKTEFI